MAPLRPSGETTNSDRAGLERALASVDLAMAVALRKAAESGAGYGQLAQDIGQPAEAVRGWLRDGLVSVSVSAGLMAEDQELTVLAAESALGLLSGAETEALDALCEIDPDLARIRQQWNWVAAALRATDPAGAECRPAPGTEGPETAPTAPIVATHDPDAAPSAAGAQISERVTRLDSTEPQRRPWMGTLAAIFAGLVAAAILLYLFDLSLK